MPKANLIAALQICAFVIDRLASFGDHRAEAKPVAVRAPQQKLHVAGTLHLDDARERVLRMQRS
jgi:hypothetical protein